MYGGGDWVHLSERRFSASFAQLRRGRGGAQWRDGLLLHCKRDSFIDLRAEHRDHMLRRCDRVFLHGHGCAVAGVVVPHLRAGGRNRSDRLLLRH